MSRHHHHSHQHNNDHYDDDDDHHHHSSYHINQLRGLVCLCYVDPENECKSIAVVDSPTEHPWKCYLDDDGDGDGDDEVEEEDHNRKI